MKLACLVCVLFIFLQHSDAVKLNYPRVLLPIFDRLSINFTLEVIEGGCFKWSSSRLDLISITPIYDNAEDTECSSKAVLTTVFREKRRSTSFVLAKDLASGEVLRCDVILDVIEQLGVLTTTRELYLEEAPETFELWAQDSQGNAFTTLEGVEFNWQISSQNPIEGKERDWHKVLRFLPFSESRYHDVPHSVERFDRQGLRGYMSLLEGINTGSARVTVRLPYNEYSQVPAIEVNIVVLANIILEPNDAHILVGDSIPFRILQLKQGKLEDITSNTQYYLEIEHTKFATIDGNMATGHTLGRTAVILKDRNVADDIENMLDSAQVIQATLTVCRAKKLTINLLPYHNWITVNGEKHTISHDLYTDDNQLITLGSAYSINSKFDESIFAKELQTRNGSQIYGKTISTGRSPVAGSFEQLKASAELQVFEKLELQPSKVFLPYDSNNLRRQKIQYKATGGDSLYTWSTVNTNTLGISQSGLAETRPVSSGTPSNFAQVKVALQRNSKISKTGDIHFLPAVKLEIVRYNYETILNDYVYLHIALYAEFENELVPLTRCDNVHFEKSMVDEVFRNEESELPADLEMHPSACHVVKLHAHGLGTSHFRISLISLDRQLRAEVNLAVFEKLDIANPITNEIILPIGASRNILYRNGPQKVFNIDAELSKTVEIDHNIASIESLVTKHASNEHIINVLCKKLGSTQLTFKIFNTLAAANHVPYVSQIITHVHCVNPRFINLYTTEKLRSNCPLKTKNALMHIKQDNNALDITVEVLDAANRRLQNVTSLVLDWQFMQNDDTPLNGQRDNLVERHTETELQSGIEFPKRDYLIATLPSDAFKIKVSIPAYDETVLYAHSVSYDRPAFGVPTGSDKRLETPTIENELSFLAVNSTLLPFNSISVFLSMKHQQRVPIIQGSGYYELKISERDIVNAVIDTGLRAIVLEPLRIGQVKIEVIDLCLSTEPFALLVSVVSIGKIEIEVVDRIEKGQKIEAIAQVYDSQGQALALDYDNLQIYELHERIWSPNVLDIEHGDHENLNAGELRYFVTGTELGETKLSITSGSGEKLLSSPAYPIQVFPPLRLSPRNATIILGSQIQVLSTGGPHPDANVEFTVQNGNILGMDVDIAKGLKLGKTIVIGRSVGINPKTSQKMVFSEDQVEINVVPLNAIKIQMPLRRARSGTVLPASVWAAPSISPLILGTLQANIKWYTKQPDVIGIDCVFSDAGVEYDQSDSISVRVKALNPGTAKLFVEFKTPAGTLTDAIELTVFKALELESPKRIYSDAIIVPPNSRINLKANLPDAQFQLAEEKNARLRVSADGILETSEHIGRDLIIATSDDQTLLIPIETKNIHYILTTLQQPTFKLKHSESKLPLGMNVALKVSLHDNLGNEFSNSYSDQTIIIPRFAIQKTVEASLGNNLSLYLSMPREGSNMLSVALHKNVGVKYNEDFIKLAVSKSHGKYPSVKTFSVGDIICFDSPLSANDDWRSSDENTLSIDRSNGVALVKSSTPNAKNVELVTVSNGNVARGFIKYDLEIRDADSVEFHQNDELFSDRSFTAHLLIKNHLQYDKVSNVIARNITLCSTAFELTSEKLFDCKLRLLTPINGNADSVLKFLSAVPIFDKQRGAYACEVNVKAKTTIIDIVNAAKRDELQIELEATLANGVSATRLVKMLPALSVHPLELAIEQIEQQTITISGTDRIIRQAHVSTSNPGTIEVVADVKGHDTKQFKVRVLKTIKPDDNTYVIINSPLTMQTIRIPIRSLQLSQKCLNQPFQSFSVITFNIISNLGLIIFMLFVLAATIWAFVYCFSSNGSQNQDHSSPFRHSSKNDTINSSLMSSVSGSFKGPPYPDQSFNSSAGSHSSILHSSVSPIYGDSTLITPNKRINRRYL